MNRQNASKLFHFASSMWLVCSIGDIFIISLWQADKSWFTIVSLSWYSIQIIFLLISLYLFAVFRGVARSHRIKIEHPLTTSIYYVAFYNTSPLAGGLAGGFGAIGISKITNFLLVVAVGSLCVTFLVWIIIDPVAGMIETLLPSARKYRKKRYEDIKIKRARDNLAKKRMLDEIEEKEKLEQLHWNKVLGPYAERLATLLINNNDSYKGRENEAIEIGADAWQMGGLKCMRQLYFMAMDICKQKYQRVVVIDYVSNWWDGIGSWRSLSLV